MLLFYPVSNISGILEFRSVVLIWLSATPSSHVDSSPRSPDLLRSEASFSLSERRSSSDSNKASSGEISPYDNNSPVLCERRGADGAGCGSGGSSGPERLFRVPEQYALVGQVAGRTRDSSGSSTSMWSPAKGEQAGRVLPPTRCANLLWVWMHFKMLSVEQLNRCIHSHVYDHLPDTSNMYDL